MDEISPQDSPIDTQTRRSLRTELPAALRGLYTAVLTETLATGNPIDPAALVVVLSAHHATCDSPLRFTSDHVSELLWFGIHEFCEDRDLVVPSDCPVALRAVLSAASQSNALLGGSDAPVELFRALEGLQAS